MVLRAFSMVKAPTKGSQWERKGTVGNHSYIHKDAFGSFPIWHSHDAQRRKHKKNDPLVLQPFSSNLNTCNRPPNLIGILWFLWNFTNYQICADFGRSIRSFAFQRIEGGLLWAQVFLLDLARWRLREAHIHTHTSFGWWGFWVKAKHTHTYINIHTHTYTHITHTHTQIQIKVLVDMGF